MPEKVAELINKIVDWLRNVFPSMVSVGLLVYDFMREQITKERQKSANLELEKEKLENEKKVEENNSNKSDSDIIRDAIDEGGKLKK